MISFLVVIEDTDICIPCEGHPTDTILTVLTHAGVASLGYPLASLSMSLNGTSVSLSDTLSALQNDDILVLRPMSVADQLKAALPGALAAAQGQSTGAMTSAAAFIAQVRGNPQLQRQLRVNHPPLLAAVEANDVAQVQTLLDQVHKARAEREREMRALEEDPLNPENQRRIEELIRAKQIQDNMDTAMEHNPASFGRVCMLYVPATINGVAMQAFVDSGAQSTIMAASMAKRCGIFHLLDTRFHGIAKGVGESRILGRIHSCAMTIGGYSFAASFTVLENESVQFLLGLDLLKGHQACIDLEKNVLRMGGTEVPFLAEAEITERQISDPDPRNDSMDADSPISTLMGLGALSEEHAQQLLDSCNGNVEQAAQLLLN